MMTSEMMGSMALMVMMMIGAASATVTHVVGGNVGWKLVNYKPNFYEEWARRRIFGVGDNLLFSYEPSSSVMMVTKDAYEKCTQRHPISSWSSGPTMLELSEPGDYYFVGLQCQLGQKLHVRVVLGPGKPGPVDFDFHFAPPAVRRELEGGEEEDSSAEQAAKDTADNAGKATLNATGVADDVDKANKTANDAVTKTVQGAAEKTNKAVNKTADDVSNSSSSSFQSLGFLCATLLPILVAMCL